jgi:hypothetical protein
MISKRSQTLWRILALVGSVGVVVPLVIWGILNAQYSLAVRENARIAAESGEPLWAGNPPSVDSFRPVYRVPRQPVVRDFEIVSAEQGDAILSGDELVIAVEVDGQARAYPINMLTGPAREIINDELAGVAIATTW